MPYKLNPFTGKLDYYKDGNDIDHATLINLGYAASGHTGFEPTLTKGNLTEATSSILTILGGTSAVIGTGTTIQVKQSSGAQSGYLSSTDWNTFNNKQNALSLGNLTAASSKISIGGTGTGAVIGTGVSVDLGTVNLDDLADVIIASPAVDQILKYNGANWINGQETTVNGGSGVDFFYVETASDIGGYYTLSKVPDSGGELDETVVCNNNKVLLAAYASPNTGLGGTQIDAGVWTFDIWGYVSSTLLTSEIIIDVYKRTAGGSETLLFSISSGDINMTSVDLYSITSVQQAFAINATDRLVAKVSGQTNRIVDTTIHFIHGGTTHYSHFNTPLVVRHNDLAGLQGGTSNQYYHLTSAEYTVATQAATSVVNGYLSSTDWSTFNGKQNASTNLTSLAGLTYVSASFVKMTAANTFTLDTNTYLTSVSGQDHSSLNNLSYAAAGHTGFEPTVTKGNLTASGAIALDNTRQVIGGAAVISHSTSAGYIHLPTAGTANQILKNSGVSGTGAWGTVTENSGALAAITTIGMSDQLTNTLADGTAPLVITSTTKVSNLNVERVDGVHIDALTNTRLLRYNSTGTKIENATVTETSGALGGITTISMSGQLTNTLAIGTSPFAVTSTTVNTNLNADMLDGQHVGTAGNTVPLLNGNNTYSGTSWFVGNVTIGKRALGNTLQCYGDADEDLFWIVPSTDRIGIGTSAPTAYLHQKASTIDCATGRIPVGTAPNILNIQLGDYWHDTTQKDIQYFVANIKQSSVGCIFTQDAGVTVANTNVETTLVGAGIGTTTLSGNFFTLGKTVRITAAGYYSTDMTVAQTLTMRIRFGGIAGTIVLSTAAITTTATMTNRGWRMMAEVYCNVLGALGNLVAQGTFFRSTSTIAADICDMVKAVNIPFNTTASSVMVISAQWNGANAADTITCTDLMIEVLH